MLRNWRGELTERPPIETEAQQVTHERHVDVDHGRSRLQERVPVPAKETHDDITQEEDVKEEKKKKKSKVEYMKDEFGRDIVMEKDKRDRKDKKRKKESKKRKHKRDRCSRSRSLSPQGRLTGTPPPADPFRPQLDENRYGRRPPPRRSMSRSRSSERYRRRTHQSRSRSREKHHHGSSRHGSSRRCRSRSRSARPNRRRRSPSRDKKWTHDGFEERSPSPMREVDPFYHPEPEAWVSRAGGVYLPRKNPIT